MAFAEKVRQYIFRYIRQLGIGCGICIILLGVSFLIIELNAGIVSYTSMGCVLLLVGISFITVNLLEWKPLLMLTCTIVALGLALWILVFKPGDNTAKGAAVVQQEAVEEASKPDEVTDEAASSTR